MMNFKDITIESLPEIRKYLNKSGNRGCTFCVGNNIVWNIDDKMKYTIIGDTVVYRIIRSQHVLYTLAELTADFKTIIEEIVADSKEVGKKLRITELSDPMVQELKKDFPDMFEIKYNRNGSDYVYLVENLIKLSGKKYHGKKNHINKFKKLYEYVYEPITPENIVECKNMAEKWRKERDPESESLMDEKCALLKALKYYEQLHFTGGLIRIDGEVVAFTFGEQITEDTFVTHFEKAFDSIEGLYSMINQQFAMNALSEYKYVNREEDMGLEGLRKAKLSYKPEFLVDKYIAVLK